MTGDSPSITIHASCVAIDGNGVLLCGRSGIGKSDLTLRLLDRGAELVSDDYTIVRRKDNQLLASPPANIAGKIEVRGVGIVAWPCVGDVPVKLWITLDAAVDRMPDDPAKRTDLLGIALPTLALDALPASAPLKVELAMRDLVDALHNESKES